MAGTVLQPYIFQAVKLKAAELHYCSYLYSRSYRIIARTRVCTRTTYFFVLVVPKFVVRQICERAQYIFVVRQVVAPRLPRAGTRAGMTAAGSMKQWFFHLDNISACIHQDCTSMHIILQITIFTSLLYITARDLTSSARTDSVDKDHHSSTQRATSCQHAFRSPYLTL